jgi:hypothetical protein
MERRSVKECRGWRFPRHGAHPSRRTSYYQRCEDAANAQGVRSEYACAVSCRVVINVACTTNRLSPLCVPTFAALKYLVMGLAEPVQRRARVVRIGTKSL